MVGEQLNFPFIPPEPESSGPKSVRTGSSLRDRKIHRAKPGSTEEDYKTRDKNSRMLAIRDPQTRLELAKKTSAFNNKAVTKVKGWVNNGTELLKSALGFSSGTVSDIIKVATKKVSSVMKGEGKGSPELVTYGFLAGGVTSSILAVNSLFTAIKKFYGSKKGDLHWGSDLVDAALTGSLAVATLAPFTGWRTALAKAVNGVYKIQPMRVAGAIAAPVIYRMITSAAKGEGILLKIAGIIPGLRGALEKACKTPFELLSWVSADGQAQQQARAGGGAPGLGGLGR